jgi:pyroglutamyl-peptidase
MPNLPADILLTGFEPYDGANTNISQKVLECIEMKDVGKICLPVSFRCAPQVLHKAIERYQPKYIIAMGQCTSGDNIRLERFAINMMDSAKGDNDGYIPNEETIDNTAPLALRTGLNIKQLQALCTDNGLPTIISNSAGLYVCNRVYYETLRNTSNALFVHIPKSMNVRIAQQIIIKIISYLYEQSF